jgi:hypothetical protein
MLQPDEGAFAPEKRGAAMYHSLRLRTPGATVSAARAREHALDHLAAELGRVHDPDRALSVATACLRRGLVHAPHALYALQGERFVAVEFHRLEPWPVFAAHGTLGRALCAHCAPVMTVGSSRARRFLACLDDGDREALRRMGAIAVIPFASRGVLVAFLCVGGRCGTLEPRWVARALAPLAARLGALEGAVGEGIGC